MEIRLEQISGLLGEQRIHLSVQTTGLHGLPGIVFTKPSGETFRASAGLTLILEQIQGDETPILIKGGIATPAELVALVADFRPSAPVEERLYECQVRWRNKPRTADFGLKIRASLFINRTKLKTQQIRSVTERPIAEFDLLLYAVNFREAIDRASRLLKESAFLNRLTPWTLLD